MSEQTAVTKDAARGKLRILLVYSRDEPELARSLAQDGHDVLAVGDEYRAQRLLTMFRSDVVLVVGPEAAKACMALRRVSPALALVAIVPDDEPEHRVTALSAGADDCVSEPVHTAELRARIRVAMGSAAKADRTRALIE